MVSVSSRTAKAIRVQAVLYGQCSPFVNGQRPRRTDGNIFATGGIRQRSGTCRLYFTVVGRGAGGSVPLKFSILQCWHNTSGSSYLLTNSDKRPLAAELPSAQERGNPTKMADSLRTMRTLILCPLLRQRLELPAMIMLLPILTPKPIYHFKPSSVPLLRPKQIQRPS